MKLNNKGYMLVEIIVAFTITMTMLYFLMNIVIKLKDINDDFYVNTKLENDQLLMTKIIQDDLVTMELIEANKTTDNEIILTFNDINNNTNVRKKISFIDSLFQYGKIDDNDIYITDNLYTKKIDSKLNIGNIIMNIEEYNTDYKQLVINIPATTSYNDTDYGVKLNINYKKNEIKIISNHKITYITKKNDTNEIETEEDIITCKENECTTTLKPLKNYNGYTVSGWYDNNSSTGTVYQPNSNITVNENLTYYANAKKIATYYYYISTNYLASHDKDDKYLYSRIHRCNNEGSLQDIKDSCKIIYEHKPVNYRNPLMIEIAASNNYIYFVTKESSSMYYLYQCKTDASNCKKVKELSNKPMIKATSNSFYYTTSIDNSSTTIQKCSESNNIGINCNSIKINKKLDYLAISEDSYIYFLDIETKTNEYSSSYSETRNIRKCNLNNNNIDYKKCIIHSTSSGTYGTNSDYDIITTMSIYDASLYKVTYYEKAAAGIRDLGSKGYTLDGFGYSELKPTVYIKTKNYLYVTFGRYKGNGISSEAGQQYSTVIRCSKDLDSGPSPNQYFDEHKLNNSARAYCIELPIYNYIHNVCGTSTSSSCYISSDIFTVTPIS